MVANNSGIFSSGTTSASATHATARQPSDAINEGAPARRGLTSMASRNPLCKQTAHDGVQSGIVAGRARHQQAENIGIRKR